MHAFIRFEPKPGFVDEFRRALLEVVGPTRAEPGCVAMDVFESIREPIVFTIHSQWIDEAAFDLHATLPHTVRFLGVARELSAHPVRAVRSRRLE
jgi:quinol monooxygenase YgiN